MTPDDLAALEEEARFLRRSIDDLERERAAGDLDDADHETLRADYERRLATVTSAISAGTLPAAPRRQLGRTLAVVGVVAVCAVGTGFVVAANAGTRDPGDNITGDLPTTTGELLDEAARQQSEGSPVDALETYDEILDAAPDQTEALAEKALLLMRFAAELDRPVLRTEARALLDHALNVDPEYPLARFYLGLWYEFEGDDDAADVQYDRALAGDPPPDLRRAIEDRRGP